MDMGVAIQVGAFRSNLGLMLVMLMVGPMGIVWLSVIAVMMLVQKVLPTKAALDLPPALAVVGLGMVITFVPAAIPGLLPPKSDLMSKIVTWCRPA
jgi:predicted metal-binding membrane protein